MKTKDRRYQNPGRPLTSTEKRTKRIPYLVTPAEYEKLKSLSYFWLKAKLEDEK